MKYRLMLLPMVAVLGLAGCKTTVDGRNDRVVIDADDDYYHGGHGDFCPPGQAKKGNC
mgnify:CR=1 FL=1